MRSKAFTLVELLVVIVLIGILSSMTAVMLSGAKTEALVKKTERQVDVIELILMSRMSEMGFSPVPLVAAVITPNSLANPTDADHAARLRLMARRDQLRMAFPDRRADLLHPPQALKYWGGRVDSSGNRIYQNNKIQPPPAWARMRVKLGLDRPATLPLVGDEIGAGETLPGGAWETWGLRDTSNNATHICPVPNSASDPVELPPGTTEDALKLLWTLEHESAECLYLIMSVTEFNGTPALDLLGQTAIANTDGDAVPEIVDAWGRPLAFVRWPIGSPAFEIQNAGPDGWDYLRSDHRFKEATVNAVNDPINLTPLVVSRGPDREFGIRLTIPGDESVIRLFSYATTVYTGPPALASSPPAPYFYPDPYFNFDVVGGNNDIVAARAGGGMAAVLDAEQASDNITNFGK